jgi:hypothetical protein
MWTSGKAKSDKPELRNCELKNSETCLAGRRVGGTSHFLMPQSSNPSIIQFLNPQILIVSLSRRLQDDFPSIWEFSSSK